MIGAAQSTALVAGISRDGVTMGAGLARGLDHSDSARFAFLLATPIILAAGLVKLPDLVGHLGDGIRGQALVGCVAAAVTARLHRRFLVRYFKTRTLTPFAIYCLLFGAAMVDLHARAGSAPTSASAVAAQRRWAAIQAAGYAPSLTVDAAFRGHRRRCSRRAARPGRRSGCCARSARAWSSARAWRRSCCCRCSSAVVLLYDNRVSLLGTDGRARRGHCTRNSNRRSKRR